MLRYTQTDRKGSGETGREEKKKERKKNI